MCVLFEVWDQRMQARFNWLWIDATTFQPYFKETAFENQLLSKTTGALALSSLRHVFHSLTPNAQGIFILLLKNQLDHSDDPTFSGIILLPSLSLTVVSFSDVSWEEGTEI